jgi:hypothetical protein
MKHGIGLKRAHKDLMMIFNGISSSILIVSAALFVTWHDRTAMRRRLNVPFVRQTFWWQFWWHLDCQFPTKCGTAGLAEILGST